MGKYFTLDDSTRKDLLLRTYHDLELTWKEIADLANTYVNKIRRDAIKLGVESRDRSEAQSMALAKGTHPHPTKGKGHAEDTKLRISESVAKDWDSLTEQEREERRQDAVRRWGNRSEEELKAMREAAGEGVRDAAKQGSKLEKFLLTHLTREGYEVQFHKEHWVIREKLQIDLFIPALNVAIEVDGPSHFSDIWGEENLRKSQQRDAEKTGLLLERGCCIIRVRQTQALSKRYKRDMLAEVLTILKGVQVKFPPRGKRHIILGE